MKEKYFIFLFATMWGIPMTTSSPSTWTPDMLSMKHSLITNSHDVTGALYKDQRSFSHSKEPSITAYNVVFSSLAGAVVTVPATGPKGRGFEPGQGDGFLRVIKIHSTPSFRWEVKPEVPCCKILRHVKDLLKSHGDGQTKFSFPSSILLLAPDMSADSTGGCQSALVDKFGVSPSRYHHTMVHITMTWDEQ
jgi:hypothetical protein